MRVLFVVVIVWYSGNGSTIPPPTEALTNTRKNLAFVACPTNARSYRYRTFWSELGVKTNHGANREQQANHDHADPPLDQMDPSSSASSSSQASLDCQASSGSSTVESVSDMDPDWMVESSVPFGSQQPQPPQRLVAPTTTTTPTDRPTPLCKPPSEPTGTTRPHSAGYWYLQHELELDDVAMARIEQWAPSALGLTPDTLRTKLHVLNGTLGLTSREDLVHIVCTSPALLHLSAQDNVIPTVQLLRHLFQRPRVPVHTTTTPGNRQQMMTEAEEDAVFLRSLVLACPSILGYSKATLKAKIGFFTNPKIMGLSVSETRDLLLREPKLVRSSVRTGLIPRFRFLRSEVNLSRDSIRHIVLKHPRMLLYSLEHNLVPKLVFFAILYCHMDTHHVERLLVSFPQFMDYHLERHTLPMAQYFLQELEYSPTEFRSLLLAYPRIVTHSLSTIKHTVGWFRYNALNFTGSHVKRILYQAPQACALKDSTLTAKLDFLQTFLDLDAEELRTIVVGMPRVLLLNVERNLQPKLEYLQHAMGNDPKTLRQALVRLPTLLGYSLHGRIQPRMQAIVDQGLPPSSITVGIPMTEAKFQAWLTSKTNKKKKKQKQQSQPQADLEKQETSHSTGLRASNTDARTRGGPVTGHDNREGRTLPEPNTGSLGRITHWTRERKTRTRPSP